MSSKNDDDTPRLKSDLPTARERFLARIVDQAFDDGWRTADDFLRHFPPRAIVESLAKVDDLRVKLLVEATGARERLALKKSISSAAEDLELALQEDITTPDAVLALYPADDKVRHLPADALWNFYAEDEFFNAEASVDATKHGRATERLTFALEVALDEKLITLEDLADGVTFDEIAARLPVDDLREVVKHAMQLSRSGKTLSEDQFMSVVPLGTLTGYVPLAHTWERVIIDKVAAPAGFCERISSVPPREQATPKKEAEKESPDASKKASTASEEAAPKAAAKAPPPPPVGDEISDPEAAPPPLPAEPPKAASPSASKGPAASASKAPASATADRPVEEDTARRRVLDKLQSIERLPPTAEALPTPLLLSIESMYADLAAAVDDEDREGAVEEAFPNETHLRTAMLALIDLLDPSVDTTDPVIRDADPKNLIKIVLFEERRRSEPRRSTPGPTPSSGGNGRRRSAPPPPVPRSSSAPPPPRQSARRK